MADHRKRNENTWHSFFEDGFAFKTVECPMDRQELRDLINKAAEVLPRDLFALLTSTLDALAYNTRIKGAFTLLTPFSVNPTSMMTVASMQAFAMCNRRDPICAAGELVTLDSVFAAFLGLTFALVLDVDYPMEVHLNSAQEDQRVIEFPHHELIEMLDLNTWCCDRCNTLQNEPRCVECMIESWGPEIQAD